MTIQDTVLGQPVVIKKYGNRRLYDTRASKYITLDGLASLVDKGATVRVVEASSGRDLTRQVLTQVLLEQHDALDMIPVELLHAVIRLRGTIEQAPLTAFLAAVARQFVDGGQLWTSQAASVLGLSGVLDDEGAVDAAATEPVDEPPLDAAQDNISGLRRRMDALLSRLDRS